MALRRRTLVALASLTAAIAAIAACDAPDLGQPVGDAPPAPADAAAPPPVIRILFVGNSYTYVNDLPGVLARLAEAPQSPVRFAVAQHAVGGQTWEGHDADPALAALIATGWDIVVLQDQSQQPWWVTGVKPAFISLDAKIEAAGAETVLFMTWAHRVFKNPEVWRFKQNMAVNRYYEQHAEAVDARVAPVGRAWELALRDPTTVLHDPDGSHPNAQGTYLAACVFYATLTGASPVGLGDGGLAIAPAEAARFQQIVDATLGARAPPAPPLVGEWPLARAATGNDLVPGGLLVLGDSAGPNGAPDGATQFASGRYAAVPYLRGLSAPTVTVAFDAHRADWSVPTTAVEYLVGKWRGYELTQDGTVLGARIATVDDIAPPPLAYDVGSLTAGWHRIALSYDGAVYRLSIDDVVVASATTSGALRYYDGVPGEPGAFAGVALGGPPVAADESVFAGASPSAFTGRLAGLRIEVSELARPSRQVPARYGI